MSWSIYEIATNVGISYFIAWAFFFVTLPLFVSIFGKVKGSVVAYAVSWLFMLGLIWFIENYDLFEKLKSSHD